MESGVFQRKYRTDECLDESTVACPHFDTPGGVDGIEARLEPFHASKKDFGIQ